MRDETITKPTLADVRREAERVFGVGDVVYDRWWPWRAGRVSVARGRSLVVSWQSGGSWRYDKPHQKFLEVLRRMPDKETVT